MSDFENTDEQKIVGNVNKSVKVKNLSNNTLNSEMEISESKKLDEYKL